MGSKLSQCVQGRRHEDFNLNDSQVSRDVERTNFATIIYESEQQTSSFSEVQGPLPAEAENVTVVRSRVDTVNDSEHGNENEAFSSDDDSDDDNPYAIPSSPDTDPPASPSNFGCARASPSVEQSILQRPVSVDDGPVSPATPTTPLPYTEPLDGYYATPEHVFRGFGIGNKDEFGIEPVVRPRLRKSHDERDSNRRASLCKERGFDEVPYLLGVFRPLIVQNVKANELLPYLDFIGDESEDIRRKEGMDGINYLLDCVRGNRDVPGRWQQFVEALDRAGYTAVVKALKGDPVKAEFDQEYRRIIEIFKPSIYNKIVPGDLLPGLKKRGVLSDADVQEIRCVQQRGGDIEAALVLLSAIPRKTDTWYSDFLEVLIEDKREDLVHDIDPIFLIKRRSKYRASIDSEDAGRGLPPLQMPSPQVTSGHAYNQLQAPDAGPVSPSTPIGFETFNLMVEDFNKSLKDVNTVERSVKDLEKIVKDLKTQITLVQEQHWRNENDDSLKDLTSRIKNVEQQMTDIKANTDSMRKSIKAEVKDAVRQEFQKMTDDGKIQVENMERKLHDTLNSMITMLRDVSEKQAEDGKFLKENIIKRLDCLENPSRLFRSLSRTSSVSLDALVSPTSSFRQIGQATMFSKDMKEIDDIFRNTPRAELRSVQENSISFQTEGRSSPIEHPSTTEPVVQGIENSTETGLSPSTANTEAKTRPVPLPKPPRKPKPAERKQLESTA